MKSTVILAHPWHGSYNKVLFDTVINRLQSKGKDVNVIDLYKDNFNPALTEKELSVYMQGIALDEKVLKYQDMLKESDEIVFIFPIWWYGMPAILRGFIDKIMIDKFAFEADSKGKLHGKLTNIKRATLISTSEIPTWYMKYVAGDSIRRPFMSTTLKDVGIHNSKWFNKGRVGSSTDASRKDFINKIDNYFK